MATVTVTIDGKTYHMACNEGQEEHLTDLSRRFNRYIHHLKISFGEIGEHRLSVMAGIMIIDEMEELEKRFYLLEREIATLERDNQVLRAARKSAETGDCEYERVATKRLDMIAKRIMLLASRISPKNQFRYSLTPAANSESDPTG